MAEHQPKRKGSQPTEKVKKDGAPADGSDPTVVHQHREFTLSKESAHLEKELVALLDRHERENPDKKVVVVQFFINQIRKIDDVNQSADIDLYLKLNWKSERWVGKTDDEFQEDDGKFSKDVWWDPGVEVTNGIELSKETPEEEAFWLEFPAHGILAYTQRCLGSIAVPLDLHNFPFDVETLPISFESFHWKSSDMKLVRLEKHQRQLPPPPGKNWGTMNGTVKLADWEIEAITIKEQTKHYDFEDRDYSQVLVEVSLRRLYSYYMWKMLLIVSIIVMIADVAFFLKPADLSDRTGICVTLFLAAITFTFVVSSSLPRIAYHTKMDFYLYVSYFFVVASLVENVVVYVLSEEFGNEGLARRIDLTFRWAYPLVFLLYTIYWFASALRIRTHEAEKKHAHRKHKHHSHHNRHKKSPVPDEGRKND